MDFFELLFLFFILLPILTGLFGKKKPPEQKRPGQGRPGQGRPVPRPQPRRELEGQEARSEPEREPVAAADMIPEDLWELLTGQKRPTPRQPAPQPKPIEEASSSEVLVLDEAEEEDWVSAPPWETARDEETAYRDATSYREPVSPDYEGPEAISLEEDVLSPERRHAAFHRKYERSTAPPVGRVRPVDSALMRALRAPQSAQQAVLMREILGPPKGLE